MAKAHVGRPATNAAASYPVGVLPVAQPAVADERPEEQPSVPSPPAASAPRRDWVAYADAKGVVVAGLTKTQIRKLVG